MVSREGESLWWSQLHPSVVLSWCCVSNVRNWTKEKVNVGLVGEEDHRVSPSRLCKICNLVSFFKDRFHYALLQKSERSYVLRSQHHTNPPATCRGVWPKQGAAGGIWKWDSTPCSARWTSPGLSLLCPSHRSCVLRSSSPACLQSANQAPLLGAQLCSVPSP